MTRAESNTAGTHTSRTAASTAPASDSGPAVTSAATHTSDWKKSKVWALTDKVSVPSRPPATAARKPVKQKTRTRGTSGLTPRLCMAVGESARPRSTRPSRVTRTTSTATTPTRTSTTTKTKNALSPRSDAPKISGRRMVRMAFPLKAALVG